MDSSRYKDLSVLLAGCGSIGRRHARILHALGVGRIAVFDPDPAQIAALRAETPIVESVDSLESGLAAHPDAVYVLTPSRQHLSVATAALDAGSHVFCEKPIADDLVGVAELARRVASSKARFMVGLCFRYHEGVRKIREHLERGAIGRIVSIRALMGEHLPSVRPDYRSLFTSQYAGAFDLMHDLDLALWLAGQEVRAVSGFWGTYSDIGIQAPDLVELLVDFEDRCVASIHLDFFQRPRHRTLELFGTLGSLSLEFTRWDRYELTVFSDHGRTERAIGKVERDDMFRDENRDFLDAILDGRPVACTISEAAKSLSVIEAVRNREAQPDSFPWDSAPSLPRLSDHLAVPGERQ